MQSIQLGKQWWFNSSFETMIKIANVSQVLVISQSNFDRNFSTLTLVNASTLFKEKDVEKVSQSHGPRLVNCLGQNNCLGSGKSQALFSSASVRETTHNEWEESAEPATWNKWWRYGKNEWYYERTESRLFPCALLFNMSNRFFKANVLPFIRRMVLARDE